MFSIAIELGSARGLNHYLPLPVSAQLRGFAKHESQIRLAELTGKLVSLTGLSATFCPTGRDLFLEKRLRLDTPSWERSVVGKVSDAALVELHRLGLNEMEEAFEAGCTSRADVDLDDLGSRIVERGKEAVRRLLAEWIYPGTDASLRGLRIEAFADRMSSDGDSLIERTTSALDDLVRHETLLLMKHLRTRRSAPLGIGRLRQSSLWMAEGRAVLTRLQTGIRLDQGEESKAFGVSENVCPDFLYAVTLVGDIKTGQHDRFHESVATGYAILAEAALGLRINSAFILAIELDLEAGRLGSHRVVGVRVDDERRQLWITQRDSALRVIRGKDAPQHPSDVALCFECPYRRHCWEGGRPGIAPTTPELGRPSRPLQNEGADQA